MKPPPDGPRGRQAQPAPAARPPTFPRPADVIRDLVTLLRGHGLTRLYWSASALLGVLSVTSALTVWCDGTHLHWRTDGTTTHWPAHDTHGASTYLADLTRAHHQTAGPPQAQEGHQPS